MSLTHHRVVIIGSGPAGYTAAIYAARAMLKPVLIEGIQPGGQLTITTDVENYPGFADPIQGPWLVEQMRAQALHVGTQIISDIVTKAELQTKPFTLTLSSGDVITADTVIICTGAQAKWLGLPSEETYRGFGVSACATCDGFFYRNKEVFVIGGGNTALKKRSSSPISPPASPSSIAATHSVPNASCRTASSPIPRSASSGTARWRRLSGAPIRRRSRPSA